MVKNPPNRADVGDAGLIPALGRSPEKEMATQYSWVENPMDKGTLQATVHGVTKELDATEHVCTE